jgi:signal transduction histidine kinase
VPAVKPLRERLADAEERLRAQQLRIAEAEHILKSALAVIGGWAKTLDDRWDELSDPNRRNGSAIIRRRADELVGLAERMLAEASVGVTAAELSPQPVHLASHLGELAASASGRSERHDVRVETDDDPVALADPAALDHVVALLVENALKYSPEGGRVIISACRRAEHAEVTVADEGIGLSADGPDLFAPFERGAQSAGTIVGSGLGLHIVRSLVGAMDGEVSAHLNDAGRGSTFVVRLPLAR